MDESVIRELEKSAKQAGMKLSAAIRIGAKLRPQCRSGQYFSAGASCAMGAAYEAIEGRVTDGGLLAWIEGHWPTLGHDLIGQAMDRNDVLGHTREQIADWLESIGY
jgi:hypothetical protein